MNSLTTRKLSFLLFGAACSLLLASGCGQPSDSSTQPAAEIRGEAISPSPDPAPAAPSNPPAVVTAEKSPEPVPNTEAAPATIPAPAPVVAVTATAPVIPLETPSAPTPLAPAQTNQAAEKIGEYLVIGFDKLAAFDFDVSDDIMAPKAEQLAEAQTKTAEQIPATVKAFDAKSIALQGYMLPLKVEGGLVTELLIMRDQSMCCYGTVPKINEWVSVKMVAKGVKPVMDQPVTIFGKLKVGEMRENGYLVGIYEMAGDKMVGPLDM